MQVSGCGSTRHFSSDTGSAEVYMKSIFFFQSAHFLKVCTVSFLPLKFCSFCRKQPLPFALSLFLPLTLYCRHQHKFSLPPCVQSECTSQVQSNSEARIESCLWECATLAKPDNITLSDSIETCYMSELLSIETCYMSELLLMENVKDVGIWRISSMGLY